MTDEVIHFDKPFLQNLALEVFKKVWAAPTFIKSLHVEYKPMTDVMAYEVTLLTANGVEEKHFFGVTPDRGVEIIHMYSKLQPEGGSDNA